MATAIEGIPTMGRPAEGDEVTSGTTLAANLIRLGISETNVNVPEVVNRTGLSRARVYALLNSIRITTGTIDRLAKGLGVDPGELTRPIPPPKPAPKPTKPPKAPKSKPPRR